MNELIQHPIVGHLIPQQVESGYINATAMCKAAGRQWGHYWATQSAKEFAHELALDIGIPISKLIFSFRGRPAESQGTWIHPRVAIHLGQWLSPKFAVRVSAIVQDWAQGFPQRKLIDQYVRLHENDWEKRFPDEFYIEIYRLHSWEWKGMEKNRNQRCGHITNVWVWGILIPGGREEIEHRNPRLPSGERRVKNHQFLTAEVGVPALRQHILGLIFLMRAVQNWDQFETSARRAFRLTTDYGNLRRRPPSPDQMDWLKP